MTDWTSEWLASNAVLLVFIAGCVLGAMVGSMWQAETMRASKCTRWCDRQQYRMLEPDEYLDCLQRCDEWAQCEGD